MKRGGTEVHSPAKPPRAVHGRMSQLDTQPDPPERDARLSQADNVAALTPDDPDLSETLEQAQASCWVTSSFSDPPLPDDALGTPAVPLSPFSALSAPSYRGNLSLPAPALVQVVNSDIFARARVAAMQSRDAALVVSGLRAPPPTSAS